MARGQVAEADPGRRDDQERPRGRASTVGHATSSRSGLTPSPASRRRADLPASSSSQIATNPRSGSGCDAMTGRIRVSEDEPKGPPGLGKRRTQRPGRGPLASSARISKTNPTPPFSILPDEPNARKPTPPASSSKTNPTPAVPSRSWSISQDEPNAQGRQPARRPALDNFVDSRVRKPCFLGITTRVPGKSEHGPPSSPCLLASVVSPSPPRRLARPASGHWSGGRR